MIRSIDRSLGAGFVAQLLQQIDMLQRQTVGRFLQVCRRGVTAINVLIIEEVVALIFHALRKFAGMTRMNAVILGRGDQEDFGIVHIGAQIMIG